MFAIPDDSCRGKINLKFSELYSTITYYMNLAGNLNSALRILFLNLEGLIVSNKKNQTKIPRQLFLEGMPFGYNLRKGAHITLHDLVRSSQIHNCYKTCEFEEMMEIKIYRS